MFGSTILDVLIGLVLIYFVLSMTCSAAMEVLAGVFRWRAKNFSAAIAHLLAGQGSAVKVQTPNKSQSALVAFQSHSLVRSAAKEGKSGEAGWPSYMHARTFGSVLLDLIAPQALPASQRRSFWALRAAIVAPETLPSSSSAKADKPGPCAETTLALRDSAGLRCILKSFVEVAEAHVPDDVANADATRLAIFRSQIETWFDETMERAGGWYKQSLQKWLFVVGLLMALALNVDSIKIVRYLYEDPGARTGLLALAQKEVATAPATSPAAISEKVIAHWQEIDSTGVPLGWRTWGWPGTFPALTKTCGLLITALAVSMGAPFWFDLLSKLVNLRAAGTKPGSSDAPKTLDGLSRLGDNPNGNGSGASPATPKGPAPSTPPAPSTILPANYWALPARQNDVSSLQITGTSIVSNAAFMARASLLAYQDEQQILTTLKVAWGITNASAKVFAAHEQQAFAITTQNFVLVAFRGTVPQLLNTILADAQVCLVDCPYAPAIGRVHCGFLAALATIQNDIDAFVAANADKPLFITGHSLGAAMGTLYAARRLLGQHAPVAGLYTYGSPRVGDPAFVASLEGKLAGQSFRFVNEEDLVTRVAPREFGYDHLDRVMYLDAAGRLDTDGVGWLRFLNTVVNALNDFKKEAGELIEDHHMEYYVRKLDNLATV